MKEQRVRASKQLPAAPPYRYDGDRQKLVDAVRDALYASKIISYAQGFTLFAAASKHFNWNLNFGDIATIWRGGCIIRAKFLNRIKEAFDRSQQLENLMLDPFFSSILEGSQANWRFALALSIQAGVAVPAFSASLPYFDSYPQERLPQSLPQPHADYLGAHTHRELVNPRW